MVKETITYVDYNGVERTEDFYFNFKESEVMELEMSTTGGLAEMINRIVQAQDAPAIINIFKKLVLDAYGVKSPDGKRFIKTQALREEFEQTEAYSQLFMKWATDAEATSKFVSGIIPNKNTKALKQ